MSIITFKTERKAKGCFQSDTWRDSAGWNSTGRDTAYRSATNRDAANGYSAGRDYERR